MTALTILVPESTIRQRELRRQNGQKLCRSRNPRTQSDTTWSVWFAIFCTYHPTFGGEKPQRLPRSGNYEKPSTNNGPILCSPVLPCVPLCSLCFPVFPYVPCVALCFPVFPCVSPCSPVYPCVGVPRNMRSHSPQEPSLPVENNLRDLCAAGSSSGKHEGATSEEPSATCCLQFYPNYPTLNDSLEGRRINFCPKITCCCSPTKLFLFQTHNLDGWCPN